MKSRIKNERGMALMIALMMLVLLTVLGLAAISTTSTEIQLTANERTDAQAFQSAEAGIKEALYRLTLIPTNPNGLVSANAGSMVMVDGISIDASIVDPNTTKGLDPNPAWAANIYFNATDPGDVGAVMNARTIVPSAEWSKLNYSGKPNQEGTLPPVTVRYMKESDLSKMGLIGDKNGDGDELDLVFYNGSKANPDRLGAGTSINGAVDVAPPANVNKNMAVMLAESTGRFGGATKKIQQEFTRYPLNPQSNAAIQTDMNVTVTGASFVSGFNHSESTVPGDSTKVNTNLYNNNGCDNYSGGGGAGDCKPAYVGPDKDPDLDCKKLPCTPYNAAYSGMTEADGHKPAVVTDSPFTAKGSMEAWGGDGSAGWLDEQATNSFPSLEKMLGLEDYPNVVQQMKDGANKDPNACPTGFTYIDNAQSKQTYQPSKNCKSGSGVMVVTGDFDINSQFEFRGLIYVMGDASLGGGSWVLGSMAVKGNATGTNKGVKLASGNPTVLYSKATVIREVMRAAMTNGAAFSILSWREVTTP